MSSSALYLILTAMKNEASFILEWIAYHRVIGFNDFLIYTNDCEDCTVDMLVRLQELGLLTHEANSVLRRGPQKSALKHALSHPKVAAADWMMFSDIDEFLVVKTGEGTVQSLVEAMPDDTDVIPVTWRLFSHNDQVEYKDAFVIEQFTDAERPISDGGIPDRFVKSIFRRQDAVERFGVHGPRTDDSYVWRRPNGRVLGPEDNKTRPESDFAYEVAQMNHYSVGCVDGFLVQKDRGRANHWRHDVGMAYWRRLCRGGETDTSALRWLEATKAEFARLMEDPVLRKLHHEAVAWRHDRVAALRNDPRFERLRTEIIKLSEARDHQRRTDAPEPATADQEDALQKLQSLCSEMRGLMNTHTPHDEAELVLGRLDDIEKGLFGKVLTE
jgi:hypothetical protein